MPALRDHLLSTAGSTGRIIAKFVTQGSFFFFSFLYFTPVDIRLSICFDGL
jgi:hypothetical protein